MEINPIAAIKRFWYSLGGRGGGGGGGDGGRSHFWGQPFSFYRLRSTQAGNYLLRVIFTRMFVLGLLTAQ